MTLRTHTDTKRTPFFGWRILILASITAALTGPGQTIGVSVFVDHFISDLEISRSQVSTAYLIGTLVAALGLPMIGRRIDKVGARRAMMVIGFAFGVALIGMAGVRGLAALTVGFFAIRLTGQGALSLVSTVSVTHWFDRKRGTALGIYSTALAILMSLVPVGLNLIIEAYSWHIAWIASGLLIWLVVLPIARFGIIDHPADVGQFPDGSAPTTDGELPSAAVRGATRHEAMRTARFWIVVSASGAVGMLSTALNFHQISMLGDAGLTSTEAAVMFLPQVVGAAVAGLFFGVLADRLTGRSLIPIVMALLAISLGLTLTLAPGATVILYAISLGAAGGASRTVTATLLPRWFGVTNIGAIQGSASLITVASTAIGPVLFSITRDIAGGYGSAAAALVVIPIVIGLVATTLRPHAVEAAGPNR
jgi:MFS family permease